MSDAGLRAVEWQTTGDTLFLHSFLPLLEHKLPRSAGLCDATQNRNVRYRTDERGVLVYCADPTTTTVQTP